MNNNANDGKNSSLLLGIVAFAIIVAVVVALFSISANQDGGSPAKPSENTTTATEVAQ
ncbi:MAG: hypothetical protein UD936_10325 [Acutalibacteraceae bacterium]|nr:hypothetical protein [Acutalibacteraceae bacterium]